jgi:hypothetical protein
MLLRLKSKEASILKTQVFEDAVHEAFSTNIDEAIRIHFPKYNTNVVKQGELSIVTIQDKKLGEKQLIQWIDKTPMDVANSFSESFEEKSRISSAIKELATNTIYPSIRDGIKKTKEFYGVSDR